MIIEQHYDEEVLIGLLDEQATDPHLQSCETCKASLRSIRNVTSALHDGSVWDHRDLNEEPRRETREALRSFAFSVASEDAAAGAWVKSLLALPVSQWRASVDGHPEWRTAGFVRKLIEASSANNYTDAARAVDIAGLAVYVAECTECRSSANTGSTAWREYAYTLYYVGRYADALEALQHAEVLLQSSVVSEYGLARTKLLGAYVYAAMEKWSEALALSRTARDAFASFEDQQRVVSAKLFEASVLMRCNRFAEALPLQTELLNEAAADDVIRACAAEHASICCRELRRFREARVFIGRAIETFERRGEATRAAMAKRHLGRILFAEGTYEQAITVSVAVLDELKDNGMAHDVALVSIDAAEAMLMLGKTDDVAALCSSAIEYFRSASLTYTEGALTALAFLREAAQTKALTLAHVANVRSFFEVLPKQPELLFASPS